MQEHLNLAKIFSMDVLVELFIVRVWQFHLHKSNSESNFMTDALDAGTNNTGVMIKMAVETVKILCASTKKMNTWIKLLRDQVREHVSRSFHL